MSEIENGNSDKLTDTARAVLNQSEQAQTVKPVLPLAADAVAQTAVDVLTDKAARDEAEAKAKADAIARASNSTNLKVAIAQSLADRSVGVRDTIIGMLAEEQLQKRITSTMKLIGMLASLEIEIRKAEKGDTQLYNADGSQKDVAFTKEAIDALKKLRENKVKYEAALEAALDKNDFTKLLEITK